MGSIRVMRTTGHTTDRSEVRNTATSPARTSLTYSLGYTSDDRFRPLVLGGYGSAFGPRAA